MRLFVLRLGLACVPLSAVGGLACGGGLRDARPDGAAADAAGPTADAYEANPELAEPPPGCASIVFGADGATGGEPLSNTLRLGGQVSGACARDHALRVTLDGRPLAPAAYDIVPASERESLIVDDAGAGSWTLATNLWCPLRDGFVPAGPHVLRASLVDAVNGDELTFRETVARFSGVDRDPTWIPFAPDREVVVGSEPGAPGPEPTVRQHTVTVDAAGGAYDYEVTLPPGYDPKVPRPVFILLHGWSRNADDFRQFPDGSGMRKVAAARGFILASPQGHWAGDPGTSMWPAFGCRSHQCEIKEGRNWYTPVFRAFVADLMARYSADARRVHVAGFSCGASYAYCLAVNFPGKFASATVMDGNQQPLITTAFGPYGYFPVDQARRIPLKIVTGAARADWEARFGPRGKVGHPWCMDFVYTYSGSQAHAWFAEFNDAIADFAAAARLD